MPEKKSVCVDGVTIKYHADGRSIWSRGKIVDGQPDGYRERYRKDGTLKRSGYFNKGEQTGERTTYDTDGNVYKVNSL